MEETIVYTNKGLNANYEEITIEEQKEEPLIRSALLNEENTKDYIKWMLGFTNFENKTLSKDTSFVGTMLSKENIMNGNYSDDSYFFVKTHNISLSNATKPKGLYAVAYHRGSYDTIGKTYDRLVNYCDKIHLHMGEFSYEKGLLDNIAIKNENDYVLQITFPVEKI